MHVRKIIKSASSSSHEERIKSNNDQEKSYTKEIQEGANELSRITFTQGGLQLSKEPGRFGKLLGLVCAAWTYLDCKEGGNFRRWGEVSSFILIHVSITAKYE